MAGRKAEVRMSARSKGLDFVREVKKILQAIGHETEGPGYGVAYYNSQMRPVHRDYWGCFDLLSAFKGNIFCHQITTLDNKARKVKAIQAKGIPGWVWARVSNGKVFYRIFIVKPGQPIEEAEVRWKV
jgi:hypothetical protein